MDNVIEKHIEIIEGYGGPQTRIVGHRINVSHIVMYYKEHGLSPAEIVEQLPTITLADVHAALAYYYDNPDLIAAEEAAEARYIEEIKQQYPSRLHEMLQHRSG
ncbi:MAG TPA: DUF433 domain-containing protein [Thermomicrobiales bacterium]|nr:DUF433 domain-containing protein [Thermomicrobiales bacterium]